MDEYETLLKKNMELRAKLEGFDKEKRVEALRKENLKLQVQLGEAEKPTVEEIMKARGIEVIDRKDMKIG